MKILKKFSVVDFIITSFDTFLIFESFSTVWIILAGSLDFPLLGSGDKYGESVSTNNLFIGIYDTASTKLIDFLNVIIPLSEINQLRLINFFAKFTVPVKQ